ncbi:MAG: YwiC-like family protein, partial [Acidimicrobiia bacterium]|nr:YwiC-like family protein [Acidimicrobiia bacterium]
MRDPAEARAASPARWRSIGLPVEHGGWGFTLEPALLGLLVAYSAAAWELAVASVAVFLARRPLRLVLTDLMRRRWLPRSR